MPRSLLIAVRFHEGRYHGQEDQFNGVDGWPPSPARLFQALVAGAARGAVLRSEDQRALAWLECLPPPRVAAPPVQRGASVKRFIPNNDLDSVGGDPARIGEIRVGKAWRPCLFDAGQPVVYVWDFESGRREAGQICGIAGRLFQLGRGVDMAWAQGKVLEPEEVEAHLESYSGRFRMPGGAGNVPVPCRGTLNSLMKRYQRNRGRLRIEGTGRKTRHLFSQPPKAVFGRTAYDAGTRRLHFELRQEEGQGLVARPLATVASLMNSLRDGAAHRLREALPENSALIEKLIVGRGAGPGDLARRIRLVPLPSVGTEHTDPSIRRMMLEIPVDCPWRVDDLNWAFSGVELGDMEAGVLFGGVLTSTDDVRMADRFMRSSHSFQSITPLALSGAPRRRIGNDGQKTAKERVQEQRRAIAAVVQGLRHAGAKSRPYRIQVQREPFHRRGVRAENFAQGSRFSKHVLWHVALHFHEPVSGPLIIGDGRFSGFGLMLPVPSYRNIAAFDTRRKIAPRHGPALLQALRRALMSLANDEYGRVDRLFSGHERGGVPDRAGHHAHVFLAADFRLGAKSTTRLIVVAPWAADRRAKSSSRDDCQFIEITQKLRQLRTRSLGRIEGLVAEPVEEGDHLLGPARQWECETPYLATRNLKRGRGLTAALIADVTKECMDRGWPKPLEIHVSDAIVGPRGGRPTARLRLRFATAVHGPLLLGRNSHAGGGLFRTMP